MAPVARPALSTAISRKRARVFSSAPWRNALGQYVTSVDALAPIGQPNMHLPCRSHAGQSWYGCEIMALSETHQCQPSLSKARPIVSPRRQRRCRALSARGICGIARQAGNAHLAIVLVVIGFQVLIPDWPVVRHAI